MSIVFGQVLVPALKKETSRLETLMLRKNRSTRSMLTGDAGPETVL